MTPTTSKLRWTFAAWKGDILRHKGKIGLALVFMLIALIAVTLSSSYVEEVKTVVVPDLILDLIPSVDLSPLFIWGVLVVVVVYFTYAFLFRPSQFHYALGMMSLFLLVRSGFIVLTHMKVPAGAVSVSAGGVLSVLSYSNDLFFSGHTGIPFLGFLVFKDSKIRFFMLGSSIALAATVLLMHVHYSIDVASAYFITYGVYVLGDSLFGNSPEPEVA